ncbi:helix-turn-helix transcriptional regulator [Ktedonobacter sp. SOSP1-52]|uniref:helix-turn-helix domain-containing protein n=1 Tax=Ktedonobacter sp. SOSP1-52 TaxID=2778366 RepID=UPI001915D378|nr:helix-turn-helix transcriptional regulator [Ktedonobacter sp. SOSP1-52]
MNNKYKYVLLQKDTNCMDLQRLQQMGKCLREARIAMDITQEYASELVGVDVATMRRWENGEIEPRNPNKERLCQVYQKKKARTFPAA